VRGGSVAPNFQRGVVLPGGESWVAAEMMIYQLLPDADGFQEGIQVGMPWWPARWHQSSLEPEFLLQDRSTRGSPAGDATARQAPRPALLADG